MKKVFIVFVVIMLALMAGCRTEGNQNTTSAPEVTPPSTSTSPSAESSITTEATQPQGTVVVTQPTESTQQATDGYEDEFPTTSSTNPTQGTTAPTEPTTPSSNSGPTQPVEPTEATDPTETTSPTEATTKPTETTTQTEQTEPSGTTTPTIHDGAIHLPVIPG